MSEAGGLGLTGGWTGVEPGDLVAQADNSPLSTNNAITGQSLAASLVFQDGLGLFCTAFLLGPGGLLILGALLGDRLALGIPLHADAICAGLVAESISRHQGDDHGDECRGNPGGPAHC